MGEAPSGILHYNLDKLGDSNNGALLVTALGDNEIQSFKLNVHSLLNHRLSSSRNFYPVGLAVDNRGGVIATDWASVSYAVHGKGRIWRISNPEKDEKIERLSSFKNPSKKDLLGLLNSPDFRIRSETADFIFSKRRVKPMDYFQSEDLGDHGKMDIIWSAQLNNHESLSDLLESGTKEENSLLRSAAVRMMVDKKIVSEEQFFIELIGKDASPYVIREAIYGLTRIIHRPPILGLIMGC